MITTTFNGHADYVTLVANSELIKRHVLAPPGIANATSALAGSLRRICLPLM
jgi:hypothetical protein